MTTQMIFRIDSKLKHAAQKRAKKQGITLTDLYKQATKSFIAGKLNVALTSIPEILNARTARSLRQIDKDVKVGKNLSPAFSNIKDAIQYLEDHARLSRSKN